MDKYYQKIVIKQKELDLINQIFEIEKKVSQISDYNNVIRNVKKIQNLLLDNVMGNYSFMYHNPIGEVYDNTKTDCQATIIGESVDNLIIIEVIKPIIFVCINTDKVKIKHIVQQGIVNVESKS